MNRNGLVASVYNRVGVAPTDGQLTPTIIGQFINEANHAIEVIEDWPWLLTSTTFTTVGGVDNYATPATWLRSDEMLVLSGAGINEPIPYRSGRELDEKYPSPWPGIPRAWSIRGDRVLLRPVPDGAYTVTHWFYRQEPDLLQDSDTPIMPASFHTAIVVMAAADAMRRVQQEGRATVQDATFNNVWLPKMQAHRRRFTGPIRVRVRAGYMGP